MLRTVRPARVLTLGALFGCAAVLRDYLKGIKLYIGLTGADRFRVLQSPAGAVRSVHWSEKGRSGYYAESGTRPDWCSGAGMFHCGWGV